MNTGAPRYSFQLSTAEIGQPKAKCSSTRELWWTKFHQNRLGVDFHFQRMLSNLGVSMHKVPSKTNVLASTYDSFCVAISENETNCLRSFSSLSKSHLKFAVHILGDEFSKISRAFQQPENSQTRENRTTKHTQTEPQLGHQAIHLTWCLQNEGLCCVVSVDSLPPLRLRPSIFPRTGFHGFHF